MRKEISIFLGLAAVCSFAFVLPVKAGTLSNASTTPVNTLGGKTDSYAVSFNVAETIAMPHDVRLIFPAGFVLPGSMATSSITVAGIGAAAVSTASIAGQEVTLTLVDGDTVTSASTTHLSGIPNIQSPYAGGSFTLHMETRTAASGTVDSASSTAFTITENLAAEQVTVTPDSPYGGRVSNYRVSFVVNSSTEPNAQIRLIFPSGFGVSSATATSTITASSSGSGIVGSSTVSGSEITIWLADGSVTAASDTIEVSGVGTIQSPYAGGSFTLGVESRTLANELSNSGSSTSFIIIASPNTPAASADISPPKSTITSPASGATITAGQKYTIEGTGTDTGGSAVTSVQVSVDNGATWYSAVVSSVGGSYNWSYVWQNPTAGDYTIKVRATDAKGNVESPSAGVTATVPGAAVSPTPTPKPTPTPTPTLTPAAETTTIQQLQIQIVQLQQQVVALLQRLLQLLQARM